jgi:hypothetical protein
VVKFKEEILAVCWSVTIALVASGVIATSKGWVIPLTEVSATGACPNGRSIGKTSPEPESHTSARQSVVAPSSTLVLAVRATRSDHIRKCFIKYFSPMYRVPKKCETFCLCIFSRDLGVKVFLGLVDPRREA